MHDEVLWPPWRASLGRCSVDYGPEVAGEREGREGASGDVTASPPLTVLRAVGASGLVGGRYSDGQPEGGRSAESLPSL